MITYLQAVGVIENFANQNEMVQKFGFEFREQMPNIATEDERYPLLFVVPIGATPTTNTNEFEIDIYCLDRYTQDRVNVGSVVSDTQLILAMLTKWLEEGQTDLDVIHSYPMQPINNDLLDYCGGWVLRVRVEVDMVSICEIPLSGVEPTPPEPIVCEPVDIYVGEALAGSFDSGSEVFVTVTQDGFDVIPEDIIVTGDEIDIVLANTTPCADATVNVNGAFWDSVPSGGTENVIVRQSSGSTQVGSKQGQYWRIADSTAVLKTTGGTTISTTSIKAEASANIVAPDTTIQVNGTTEGTVMAGSTVDVQLSDSGGVVTPDSVTIVGNDLQIVLPDAPLNLYWELNYNGTDDIIFIPATVNNIGTLTSGSGSNVGTITVSTDGVTYGALSFPFTPIAATTYYFKRSTATVTGSYTMVGTYV